MTLSLGQIKLTSQITWENKHFVFAALHLGGWDFYCCISAFDGRLAYTQLKQQLFTDIKQASSAKVILSMNRLMGDRSFSLQDLFAEERQRIVRLLTAQTKEHLDRLYTQVYRENYSMLAAFQREQMSVPQELKVAAEVTLSHRCIKTAKALEQGIEYPAAIDRCLAELEATATEANYLECWLNIPDVKLILEQTIARLLWRLLHDGDPTALEADVARIAKAIAVGDRLRLGLALYEAQEIFFNRLHQYILPNCLIDPSMPNHQSCRWDIAQIKPLLKLGQRLAIDVSCWL